MQSACRFTGMWRILHTHSFRSFVPLQITQCRQTADICRTKSQNLNVSRLVLRLTLPNPLNPGVKSRMKMYLEQRQQATLRLHLTDQQIYCLLTCEFIRGLTVSIKFKTWDDISTSKREPLWCHLCRSGPRLNIKTVLSTYGNFHVKDKTAVRTSYL